MRTEGFYEVGGEDVGENVVGDEGDLHAFGFEKFRCII